MMGDKPWLAELALYQPAGKRRNASSHPPAPLGSRPAAPWPTATHAPLLSPPLCVKSDEHLEGRMGMAAGA